ncbi:hypothetical protein Taro_025857 [Colocasia esculenta]|uniref:RING-type E3 ubiquitin transferase n=1 Tax=Colocasia esculenta TaxID=4460 RepID=A0A843VAF6_COLES|nr:hypothetical protein [Colocasia esculenta]
MTWAALHQISHRDSSRLPSHRFLFSPSPSSSSKKSPAVLFIIVILAFIVFVSGLLHLLIRFLTRQGPPSSPARSGIYVREIPGSYALQRQLQQLFHLHDSGLDQSSIDALPVFLYREVVGPKEPSDCAVCLCEFAEEDKLRLLPACSHAFHINCIDTWLLSNSTCPLCRESLFVPGRAIENPVFDSEEWREEVGMPPADGEAGHPSPGLKAVEVEEGRGIEKRVFSVRIGKFRSLNSGGGDADGAGGDGVVPSPNSVRREEGASSGSSSSSSSNSVDARRCYSMGAYQYVVAGSNLQVALSSSRNGDGGEGGGRRSVATLGGADGKMLWAGSKGESLSVSKIWQWSGKKGKFSSSADTASEDGGLPWIHRTGRET